MKENRLENIVELLCRSGVELIGKRAGHDTRHELPSRAKLVELTEALRSVLFPGFFGVSELTAESMRYHIGATLDSVAHELEEQVERGLCCPSEEGKAAETVRAFLARLPEVSRLLRTDVEAAYKGDPALKSRAEAIFCYPGIFAITNQRIAHELHLLGVPLIPRIITEHAHSLTGIDIHPGARIGDEFFIDHGTGVVIGETCVIGKRVRIYQGVTLGARSFPLDEHGNPIKGVDRHPILEDDVTIYSGATVLGRVTIGAGSTIGGNVWLTKSVPPKSVITQAEAGR